MPDGLSAIIAQLEKQRESIDAALAALRELDGDVPETAAEPVTVAKRRGRPPTKKGGMTEEGRKRLSESLKQRWAAKRAGAAVKAPATKKTRARSEEGRVRQAETMRKLWAAKRTAAKPKKQGRKRA